MNKEEIFIFLDNLRESGSINMFGARLVVQEMFGLSRYEAKDVVLEWMQTFSQRHGE